MKKAGTDRDECCLVKSVTAALAGHTGRKEAQVLCCGIERGCRHCPPALRVQTMACIADPLRERHYMRCDVDFIADTKNVTSRGMAQKIQSQRRVTGGRSLSFTERS